MFEWTVNVTREPNLSICVHVLMDQYVITVRWKSVWFLERTFRYSPGFCISAPCQRFSQKYDATATRLFEDNDLVHLASFLVWSDFVAGLSVLLFFPRSVCLNNEHVLRLYFEAFQLEDLERIILFFTVISHSTSIIRSPVRVSCVSC